MIDISAAGKQAFIERDDIRMYIRFSDGTVITNEEIVNNSTSIEQTLCDEEQLVFGSLSSACFTAQILKTNRRFKGLKFTVIMTAHDAEYVVPLGTFTVTEDTLSDNRRYRTIKGYDEIYLNQDRDMSEWYQTIDFPVPLRYYRDSFFDYVGIEQEDIELVNDNMIVERTIDVYEDTLTFRMVLQTICEINGALGCMTQENKFRYKVFDFDIEALYPRDDLYPDDDIYPGLTTVTETISTSGSGGLIKQGSYVYSEYTVKNIEKVVIKESDEDYGTIYGVGSNTYAVVGNFLAYANTDIATVAANLYEAVRYVSYIPTKLTSIGMPWVEPGDYIRVVGINKVSVFPLLHRTLKGISACVDDYEAKGTEYTTTQLDGVNASIQQLKSRTLKLRADVFEVSSELDYYEKYANGVLEDHNSRIKQTAEEISLEVSERKEADNDIIEDYNGKISVLPHTISMQVTNGLGQHTNAGIKISLLDEDGNEIDSANGEITLTGDVVFKSNLVDGSTVISGNNIKTGLIDIGGGSNETVGIRVWNDDHTQLKVRLDRNGLLVNDGYINSPVIVGGTIIAGNLTGGHIYGTSIEGVHIKGVDIEAVSRIYSETFSVDSEGAVFCHGDIYTEKFISATYVIARFEVASRLDMYCGGDFYCEGSKNRIIDTEEFGKLAYEAYETPQPHFGDIGSGMTNEEGECIITIDPKFSASTLPDYHVFIQPYDGATLSVHRDEKSFTVTGTPNAEFSYEIKAVQRDKTQRYKDIPENILNGFDMMGQEKGE